MRDEDIRERIEALEAEERRLRGEQAAAADGGRGDILAADRERLEQIEVELAQLWDLLRQRRGLRDAGRDPDEAGIRDEGTVEGYLG